MLTALLAATLLAQGLNTSGPGLAAGGKVLASYPLSTTGPLITEDANTVAHVYWNGTALVDTKGNSWTMNGTVPQVTANPFTTTRYGAGPFTIANYYSRAGDTVLALGGDFTACITWMPTVSSGTLGLASNTNTNDGWKITYGAGATFTTVGAAASTTASNDAAGVVVGAVNIACFGRNAGNQYLKLNLRAVVTTAGTKTVPGTGTAYIGVDSAGANPTTGTGYELYFTTTAFTDAAAIILQQKVLGHFDGYSALTVTRATNATYAPLDTSPHVLYTAAPGVARFTSLGMLVEPARTNSLKQSNTISTANNFDETTWISWPDTTVVDVTTTTEAAPGGGTYHTITNEAGATSNVGQAYQTASAGTSSEYWVASAWVKKPVGEDTTHASLHIGCGAGAPRAGATNCLCYRSDGGACTASTVATNYCQALVADLSTTPVRLTVGVRCDAALTTPIVALVPGSYGVSIGITDFSGVQAESATIAELYSTSNIVTTTTATARNIDVVTATIPSSGSKFCAAATEVPITGRGWPSGEYFYILGAGNPGAAQNWRLSNLNVVGTGAASYKLYTYAALSTTVAHRMVYCNNTGSLSLSVDGSPVALTGPFGAGDGIVTTPPTTLYIGSRATTSTGSMAGYLKNVKICKATKAKECP